jgi:hypothetical protein
LDAKVWPISGNGTLLLKSLISSSSLHFQILNIVAAYRKRRDFFDFFFAWQSQEILFIRQKYISELTLQVISNLIISINVDGILSSQFEFLIQTIHEMEKSFRRKNRNRFCSVRVIEKICVYAQ